MAYETRGWWIQFPDSTDSSIPRRLEMRVQQISSRLVRNGFAKNC